MHNKEVIMEEEKLLKGKQDLKHTSQLEDPAFIKKLRVQMLKFSTQQLRDANLAEEAVQEALLAAFKNTNSYTGQVAIKTWVFAILKNKIIDTIRAKKRLVNSKNIEFGTDEERIFSELFDKSTGCWRPDKRPVIWKNPEESMNNNQFWIVFETCLEHLSENQSRAFMMREFLGFPSNEICETVGINYRNLNVLLHRARLRLRECLENQWFKR